jgi:transposase-like protein
VSKTIGRGRPRKTGVDEGKIRSDYLDTTQTVASICEAHGIDPHKLYRVLDAMDVPRRESAEFEDYGQGGQKSA